jgi:hypothetical protein
MKGRCSNPFPTPNEERSPQRLSPRNIHTSIGELARNYVPPWISVFKTDHGLDGLEKNQLKFSDVPKPHLPALSPACQVIHPEDGPQALPGSQQRRVLRKVLQQRGGGHRAEVASQEPGPSLGKQKRGWVNTYKNPWENHWKIIYKLAVLMRNSSMVDFSLPCLTTGRYLGG